MHPIERLRYVARADGSPQSTIVAESARALTAFADDPAGMVAAVQRLIAHHPTAGAMWWMGGRVLTAPNGAREAFALSEEIEDDPTARELTKALDPEVTVLVVGWPPEIGEALARRGSGRVMVVDTGRESAGLHQFLDHRGVDVLLVPLEGLAAAVRASDIVAIECEAGGPDAGLFGAASASAAAVARCAGVEVWATVGVGRMLPQRLWDALIARWEILDEPWELAEDLVEWTMTDRVVGPGGPIEPHAVTTLTTAALAPELLRF